MANRGLTPWTGSRDLSPFVRDPFSMFRREVDRLFDDVLAPSFAAEPRSFTGATAPTGGWPSLDVEDTGQAYLVTAEIPGIDRKDVELTLRDNTLCISGEKRAEHQEANGGRTYAERMFGRFQRVIPFDQEVEADKVEASFKDGVLKITLPKNPKAQDQTRRIEIRPQ